MITINSRFSAGDEVFYLWEGEIETMIIDIIAIDSKGNIYYSNYVGEPLMHESKLYKDERELEEGNGA